MANIEIIRQIFEDSINHKKNFISKETNVVNVLKAADSLYNAYKRGNKVLVFGNGGSASDSQHMAAELVVRLEKERRSLPCIALNTDSAILTACGNDYDFTSIFSRQIESLGNKGDIAFVISTSGKSPNIIKAATIAKKNGLEIISLTGRDGGELPSLSDIFILVEGKSSARIQETHILIIHILCKLVEDRICSDGISRDI
ncbi:phosphoheptose isomerase [Candidatus Omnitrophus magneticus]|uniref:Phosphoheptose isomerase n=1 Tax=Candidatus Omnitrophus magneticus TaxID=1609969 RepID=A0A0F0CLT9_9BACT|nr:phosphoheptose isomerase [Candidatus Omnitrophus magneticus]